MIYHQATFSGAVLCNFYERLWKQWTQRTNFALYWRFCGLDMDTMDKIHSDSKSANQRK